MFETKKILFPFDGSDICRSFASQVIAVGDRLDAAVTLLYVREERTSSDVDRRAADFAEFFKDQIHHRRFRHVVASGSAAATIVELADSEEFDLIMIPSEGRGRLRRLFRPSTVETVVRECRCAVWTAWGNGAASCRNFSNVVCGLDLEADSRRILATATEMTALFGRELSIVHAMPDMDENLLQLAALDELPPTLSPELAGDEISRLQRLTGSVANVHIQSGGIGRAVSRVARRGSAGLWIIGPGRDLKGTQRIGQNVLALVRSSHCPVLILEKTGAPRRSRTDVHLKTGTSISHCELVNAPPEPVEAAYSLGRKRAALSLFRH